MAAAAIKKMIKAVKEKIVGATGSVSGIASILGSWQVCHNICLGIIALLAFLGITVVGMPLMFLTKLAVPFWTAAFLLLLVTLWFYFRKRCISNRLIMFNSGLIIAGVPFQPLQQFSPVFWVVGGSLAIMGVSLFVKDKIINKR
ncbi:hypothetical protein D6745_04705 [Candidatus Woesearchaeota archaeon]|nr:MAG: hypothetical protein D6745_04705 [Candidatus Woesearchaeota archaeon]